MRIGITGLCRRRAQDYRLRAGYTTGPNTGNEVLTALTITPQMRAFIVDYVKKANR